MAKVIENQNGDLGVCYGATPKGYTEIGPMPAEANGVIDVIVVNDIEDTLEVARQSLDGNGDPVFETLQRNTYDLDGNQILDELGDPVLENYQSEVYDVDGNGDVIFDTVGQGTFHKEASVDTTLVSNKATADAQRVRDSKLALMREQRKDKLQDMDNMVVDLTLGNRTDTSAIATYKTDLLAITNSYKDTNPLVGLLSLDSLADDLSDFTWPSTP